MNFRKYTLLSFSIIISALLSSCDYDLFMNRLENLGTVDRVQIYSEHTHDTYDILVFIPDQYDAENLPSSAYLLDAYDDILSACRSAVEQAADAGTPVPVMIGIDYVGEDMRSRDFTFIEDPSMEDETGGGESYSRFLREELVPFIESRYPTNQEKRYLMGHSAGGLFCINNLALEHKDPVFTGYVAASPALWFMNQSSIDYTREQLSHTSSLNTMIYLSVGEREDEGMHDPLNRYTDTLNYLNIDGLTFTQEIIENKGHGGSARPSYENGLAYLLKH